MAAVDLPMVHIFSTQTVAKFYRRRPKVNLDMVAIAYWSGEAAPAAVGEGRWRIEVRRPYLAVRTTWPATRPAHSLFKFRAYPLNVLPSGFRFLDGDNPADPLIAREWRNILPFCPRRRVRNENSS